LNGTKRRVYFFQGVLTDRLLQQEVGQILAIKFEMDFEDYSYGFRPNRNAQPAVLKARDYINSGHYHIIDIDLIPIMYFVGFVY